MRPLKSAFTMIELVFVIVILGILAALAIPRLSGTRDDAKVAATAQSVVVGMEEIAAHAVSRGEANVSSIAEMSNSFAAMERRGDAVLSSLPMPKAVIKAGKTDDCLTVDINTTGTDEILQVSFGNTAGDVVCEALQERLSAENYYLKLRGENVIR